MFVQELGYVQLGRGHVRQDAAMCAKMRPCAPKNGCVRQGRKHVRQRRGYVR